MNWKAHWIWIQNSSMPYHQTVVARKDFDLAAIPSSAVMKITADCRYRLKINGEWVADGPGRSWPWSFSYDVLDVGICLCQGINSIEIVAQHWHVGTFHAVPQCPGLLAQLDMDFADGSAVTVATDKNWSVAEASSWVGNTAKTGVQKEPQEYYDARLEPTCRFEPALELYAADSKESPWQDLKPRDVALMYKTPIPFVRFVKASVIRRIPDCNFCLAAVPLSHPGLVEANIHTGLAGGMATSMTLSQKSKVQFHLEGMCVSVNGKRTHKNSFLLEAGTYLVVAFVNQMAGHGKERTLRIVNPPHGMTLVNPLDSRHENSWCFINLSERAFVSDDLVWSGFHQIPLDLQEKIVSYIDVIEHYLTHITDAVSFDTIIGDKAISLPQSQMFLHDDHWRFVKRKIVAKAVPRITDPQNLMADNAHSTVIYPSTAGDIELIFDLGTQTIGYYDIQLVSGKGVVLDIYGVEYMTPSGLVQHTDHNGMRYITKEGTNRFVSFKRRAGRYLFITIRNLQTPLSIRKIQVIESTYPVEQVAGFSCSDPNLDRIWEITNRTLKLCMEDTYTDCPLYEQTLWVGDARNEGLYGYTAFNATDISRRCIVLAAESLKKYDFTGAQVPSSWEVYLPAWSFLWGISVWEYYFYTGEQDFLRELWPAVIRNLKGAEKHINDDGFFGGPFWNFFDWAPIDQGQCYVTHNNMLYIGAIDAAIRCAEVLNNRAESTWLIGLRKRLGAAAEKMWDPKKKAYRDSLHEDGSRSPSVSQHTSFLSLLYTVGTKKNLVHLRSNLNRPPKNMTKVGSPFALQYYYEALEKIDEHDKIIKSFYTSYMPMIQTGATTVWETFPAGELQPDQFPTRSHCHGWSSAPLYFLPRIILGIRQIKSGGTSFQISPRPNGLMWAKGSAATILGRICVAWTIVGKTFSCTVDAPKGVKVVFKKNRTLSKYDSVNVTINNLK